MTSVEAADNQLICRCKDAGQQRVLKFHLLVAQSWVFFPPFTTGLVLHSQVGEADVHRGSCGKEDLDKPTNSSLHFAMQEWVTPQSPALCHPLCLPRPADAKVQCRALRRSWGDIFLLYLQGNIGREGGLDAYLAALVHSVSLASQRNDKMIKNGIMSKRKIFKINCRHQRWLFLHINVGVFCFFFFRFFFPLVRELFRAQAFAFISTNILRSAVKPLQTTTWGFILQTSFLPPLRSSFLFAAHPKHTHIPAEHFRISFLQGVIMAYPSQAMN